MTPNGMSAGWHLRSSMLAMGLFIPFVATAEDGEINSRPSILVVVLDTVRADAVSAYGQVEGTTPNFDRLAENGVRYTRAFSTAPWTVPAHAPLVVNGLEALKPGVIEAPVGLVDVMPTILEWVGANRSADLPGRPLPLDGVQAEAAPPRTFFSAYTDQFITVPDDWKEKAQAVDPEVVRQFCVASNRVYGGMAALIRYPFKYVWYEHYAPSLYDLSWDPNERSDQMRYRRDLAESFAAEMKRRVDASRISEQPEDSQLAKEALEALKQLGYVH